MLQRPQQVEHQTGLQLSNLLRRLLLVQLNERATGRKAHEGIAPSCFIREETSSGAYDPRFSDFVSQSWDDLTRASECKSDVASNPFKNVETKKFDKHRVHWIENRIQDLLSSMLISGRRKFGPGFHLSERKMVDLMPYYVKVPGRKTCVCRYHMAFDHRFNAYRRWKQSAYKAVKQDSSAVDPELPSCSAEMRSRLCCNRGDSPCYKPACCNRTCKDCEGSFDSLASVDEKTAKPRISWNDWTSVPYKCKDGREVSAWDFVEREAPIETFLAEFKEDLEEFLPHHNRAKWLDNDWAALWRNVSAVPHYGGMVCYSDGLCQFLHSLAQE